MDFLYSPWRSTYCLSNKQKTETACVFCAQYDENEDDKNFILKRAGHVYVMLNLYPYNAGHLMVLPITHCANLDELDSQTQSELMSVTATCTTILREALHAQGINVGINLGKVSGGSLSSHLHVHVLPRFEGDTNFLPVLAGTKQISLDLRDVFQKLKPFFE